MKTVNVHEAKTHFSQLLSEVEAGGRVTIARAGKPIAILQALPASEETAARRFGAMRGRIQVPDDFDTMFADEIEEMFSGVSQ